MSEKITPMPISYKERDYNLHGTGYVPCEVSGRYLQFSETYSEKLDLVSVDVMTTNDDRVTRKLCTLVLHYHDLLEELSKIKPK